MGGPIDGCPLLFNPPVKDMLSLHQVVARNPRLASRAWPDETVVYSPDDHFIHSLNETGGMIWAMLADRPTVAQIAGRIHEQFEVDEDQATRDVIAFLETLMARGLAIAAGDEEEGSR